MPKLDLSEHSNRYPQCCRLSGVVLAFVTHVCFSKLGEGHKLGIGAGATYRTSLGHTPLAVKPINTPRIAREGEGKHEEKLECE